MTPDCPAPRLVLASASPRRLALLEQVGLAPDAVVPADIDETPQPNELPRAYVARVAEAKTRAVAARSEAEGAFVLGADTVVAAGRRILGKPSGEAEARAFLELLSGRRHRVTTAVCLSVGAKLRTRLVETRVRMKRLSDAEITDYVGSGEWQGKAGGYAIQGRAGAFVLDLVGSYTAVVGLPLAETVGLLVGNGYRARLGAAPP